MLSSQYFFGIVILLLSLSLSSCVSKKKHMASLQSLRDTNEKVVNDWQKKFNEKRKELNASHDSIRKMELNLAERKGENNVLNELRKELELQIEVMESQMSNLGSTSKSTEQQLKIEIQKKESKINDLRLKLSSVNSVLDKHKSMFENVSSDLSFEMQNLEEENVIITTELDEVIVILPELSIFKNKSASRITDSGNILLEKIAEVLNKYPQLLFKVVGHTDNTPANVKKYKDNWNYSTLQAASVVRLLVADFDMNPSQLTASGKGEFDPRTSNSTSEGRKENRRIEIVIYRNPEDLAKEIKKITTSP